ncbi:MAG: ROK family protein [Acidimicrobiia bacterium]|nr:ROK family protein [Acidimicrobiia bacterium]
MTKKRTTSKAAEVAAGRVGVDIGGTKILVALVDGDEVVTTRKRSTPRTGVDDLVAAVVEMIDDVEPAADAPVGIGIPGLVLADEGVVRSSPNIDGIDDDPVPIRQLVADATGRRVALDNDVNVATLAEHRLGAAVGVHNVLGVFVGTGVGGGLVLGGRLRHGPHGLAGEIGHSMVTHRGGEVCSCGRFGHLEAYAGRAALERRARAAHDAGRATVLIDIAGKGRMKSSVWAKALAADDELARELITEARDALVAGLISVVVTVDVDVIVLGGGLASRLGEPFRVDLEQGINDALFADTSIEVRWAMLGDDSGAVGAACLLD